MSACVRSPRRRVLALALLAAAASAPPVLAQTGAVFPHVIELEYAPAAALPGVDLRAGAYQLELRGGGNGAYAGVLRGPNNEIVDDELFVSSTGCNAGALPASGRILAGASGARAQVNPLALTVSANGSSACRLSAVVNDLGLVTATDNDGVPLECGDPEQLEKVVRDDGPVCAPPPPLGFTAPAPDLRPGRGLDLGAHRLAWGDSVVLSADTAIAKSHGRCFFPYSHGVRNSGTVAAPAASSAMLSESVYGLQLDAQPLPPLAAGARTTVAGEIGLPPGKWRVYAHVDAASQVAESNGTNNASWVRVRVTGNCGGALGGS